MCGICGILNLSGAPVHSDALSLMTNEIRHRGPNEEGHHISNNLGMGFRRLSIIDLKTGSQPISNENKDVWITFNGEIYNYKELRTTLQKQGHEFTTQTDSEVIVHLYEEHGIDCLQHLRGMFAFTIWDDRQKLMFAARDRMGQKPFYYSLQRNEFLWASEIKSILEYRKELRQIDYNAFDQYFSFGYIHKERSIFKDIKKLPAAHYLIVDTKKEQVLTIGRYWEIPYKNLPVKSIAEYEEELYHSFAEAVKLRLVSDVPLGAFLSGGIDSSSVVAMMSQFQQNVKTFSVGFREESFNELPFAREMVDKYDTEHHEIVLQPESVKMLPKLVQAFDEPFADSSAIPCYYINEFASKHVTVALSGDGGDELFAGYNDYPRFLKLSNWNRMPSVARPLFGMVARNLSDGIRGKIIMNYLAAPRGQEYAYASIWQNYERKRLYNPDVWMQIDTLAENSKLEILRNVNPRFSYLSKLQQCDLNSFLVDDVLTKVDRTSMCHSLEVRSPLLDHKLVELAFSMPDHAKIHQGSKKYIFKKAMGRLLTNNVVQHKKQGFAVPLAQWFRHELFDYLQIQLNDNPHVGSFFDKKYLNTILQYHKLGRRDYGSKLWSVLFFLAWHEQVMRDDG